MKNLDTVKNMDIVYVLLESVYQCHTVTTVTAMERTSYIIIMDEEVAMVGII